MSGPVKCGRCGREFRTTHGLGQHLRHFKAATPAGRERLCPERRSPEEVRDVQLRQVRLKAKLGLLGRHP